MKSFLVALGIAVALFTAPAMAVSGGELGTLERGPWACEMPGDAASTPGVALPAADFEITNDSTYRVGEAYGTYLRTGDEVQMTSGPRKGDRYTVQSEHFLRKLGGSDKDTGLRCIRLGEAGSLTGRPTGTCEKAKQEQADKTEDGHTQLATTCEGAPSA